MRACAWLWILLVCLAVCHSPALAEAVSQPGQPAAGPGSSDYDHERVRASQHGEGTTGYLLFEPVDAGDKPLPVVLFVHGLNQQSYSSYWLWIRHLVRRGNIVIYPRYQLGLLLDQTTFTQATADATRDALKRLDGKEHVEADAERFAVIGHSLGGAIVANLAARAEHYGVPQAKAVMAVQPGDVKTPKGLGALLPAVAEDYATVPAGTLMLVIASERDNVVGQSLARQMIKDAKLIDDADKDLLLIGDDAHGWPRLVANHFVPLSYIDRSGRERADAYDFALWRWFDALTDAAYYEGKHRDFALGDTPEQRMIGLWSDGKAIREAQVVQRPWTDKLE